MMRSQPARSRFLIVATLVGCLVLTGGLDAASYAQEGQMILVRSGNRPLASLVRAGEAARHAAPPMDRVLREVPNYRGHRALPSPDFSGPDPLLQEFFGSAAATVAAAGFEGASNEDNLSTLGFRVAPPDTNGEVGRNHFVQMINLVTEIFDKYGRSLSGPFPSNAIWAGVGGNCQPYNQGDPVVLYDEANDRWVVSQFAFDDNFTTFSQCIAVSQTSDPGGAYNRYEFSFDGVGLPDYPKHGVVSDSITMTANIFAPPVFMFTGTFVGAMDKGAMYAGQAATMVASNLGSKEFGFLPADLDDPSDTAAAVPALFATAMSSRRADFDIWQIDVDWSNPGAASRGRIARIDIPGYDSTLCGASRGACIAQPDGGPALESISDRLMHRLQVRQIGSSLRMVAAHTVDADGQGTAGVRWYELRRNANGGPWGMHQMGTYAPGDGLHRWMPSLAMNGAGDLGMGFLVSSTSEYLGSRYVGQTAGASGSGQMDASEGLCRVGVTEQTGTGRSGDYSATTVDPIDGTFWHTNEYGQRDDKAAGWGTWVCQFAVAGGGCVASENPESSCSDGVDNDCDGAVDGADADCAPTCTPTENPEVSCNDGVDNDCDGAVDGDDADCAICVPEPENTPATCSDGIDNDCDGDIDAADADCTGVCIPTHTKEKGPRCSDGIDNDCDGAIDAADPDC